MSPRAWRARSATCRKQSPVFEGHFPGYPLMPGVLLIECMAQTTGWLVSALTGFTGLPALAGVKEGKIRSAVFPGDELEFEGRVIHEGSGYAIGEAKGWCKGAAICDANADLSHHSLSEPGTARRTVGVGRAHQFPGQGVREVTELREVWITGVGLLTCLGEGLEAAWAHLERGDPPPYDDKSFAPYIVHQLAPMSFDKHIPKKSDQRQMETWQRVGVYSAGMALTDAGIAGNAELLDRADMIVAAGGGERDIAVDTAIMAGLRKTNEPGAFLNERLMSDLRPTLFLAQLPNLLAGNISLVHGVVGSSRTFMGEEAAGVDAVRVAQARIAAGQSELTLVGGAYHGTRWDVLLAFELGGVVLKDKFAPVWDRGPQGGIAFGTMGAFLVLESREHAQGPRRKTAGADFAGLFRPQCAQRGRSRKRRCAANGTPSRRRSTGPMPRSFPAPPASNRRPRPSLMCSRISVFRSAIPVRISGMGSIPSSWPIWASAAR